jgi:putative ABC transport system permease protein
MNPLLAVLSTGLEEGLLYACVGVGVWLSFRVLAFPDLTVDGSFPLGAAVAAVLLVAGQHPLVATAASVVAGLLAGLATGVLNTKLRINALLAGILVMTSLYSVNLAIMRGSNVALLSQPTLFDAMRGWLGGPSQLVASLAVTGLVLAGLAMLLIAFLHTHLGLALRATGDNEQMIRGLGVDTHLTTLLGLCLANGVVALGGALAAQHDGFADVGMGVGMIVVGLAAVILGEALLRGRGVAGAIGATIVGMVVYRVIISAALRVGLGPTNLKLVTALLVIAVLSAPAFRARSVGVARRLGARVSSHADHPVADQDVLLGHR